ncbi:MAG TPA: ATP-binding protein [Dongiaceae bacterium]|nr:ATP-binding protein [Dongiaceae bacterium]
MKPDAEERIPDQGLAKTALIRELVDLSTFTEGILRTLGSAVVAVDASGRIVYVNPAAESLLGASPATLLSRPAAQVLVMRGGESLLPSSASLDAMGEVDLLLPDGRTVTVDVRVSRREDAQGGLVAILTDRTELKRAEVSARRKERLASLGELSAGVAHEIRNPLAGIGASAQLLGERLGADENHRRLIELILDEVARLDRIVESMLQFARPPEPRLRLAPLRAVLDRALGLLAEDAETAGVTITTHAASELPQIWIDSDQIEQVVLNLARNALQAMEESGGSLTLTLRRVSRPRYVRVRSGRRREDRGAVQGGDGPLQDWVELELRDTGHGIPPEEQDRIFNPFYTTRKRGTGLGLAISEAIVREHGGMITVQSTPGHGTTVLVDLPEDKRQSQRRTG